MQLETFFQMNCDQKTSFFVADSSAIQLDQIIKTLSDLSRQVRGLDVERLWILRGAVDSLESERRYDEMEEESEHFAASNSQDVAVSRDDSFYSGTTLLAPSRDFTGDSAGQLLQLQTEVHLRM